MSETAYERYGGFEALRKVVMDFYDRTLDTPALAPYFAGVDLNRLIEHQTVFVCQVLGGPVRYTDKELRRAHAHLGITESDFADMGRVLRETLKDHGVAEADIATIMDAVVARAPSVVTRP
jgi:hemoglobin